MENAVSTIQNDAHAELSARVHRWRRERGLSQAQLADQSGFARSTLSKIENGQLSPTFEILLKLARGFDVDVADLLNRQDRPALTGRLYVDRGPKGESDEHVIEYSNNRLYPLAAQLKDKSFESMVVEFTCADLESFGPWNRHDTEDMLYVLEGELAFHSEGYETFTLTPGQSIHFDGRMAHACLSVGDKICRCLYVFAEI